MDPTSLIPPWDVIRESLIHLVDTAITITFVVLAISAASLWARRRRVRNNNGGDLFGQTVTLSVGLLGFVAIILSLPINHGDRRQLLSLVGLLLSGALALASSSFLGNIMAGLFLRSLRHMTTGDLIEVEGRAGRITERGLFHVEVQTEDRDLTTFPNNFLASHPTRIMRSSGTLVASSLSIGYDVPRQILKPLFLEAAEEAGLADPFVRVIELGDYAITYRVAGLLNDVQKILTVRSLLNEKILDRLHAAGIEIASPTLMNQRPFDAQHKWIPRVTRPPREEAAELEEAKADRVAFDKADAALMRSQLELLRDRLTVRITELEAEGSEYSKREVERTRRYLEEVGVALERQSAAEDDDDRV